MRRNRRNNKEPVSDVEREEIIAAYKAGRKISPIANNFGRARHTIRQILKAAGFRLAKPKTREPDPTPEEIQERAAEVRSRKQYPSPHGNVQRSPCQLPQYHFVGQGRSGTRLEVE